MSFYIEMCPQFRDVPIEGFHCHATNTLVPLSFSLSFSGAFGLPCIGLVPLCIKSLKDVEHINPMDGSVVGKYDRGADLGLK